MNSTAIADVTGDGRNDVLASSGQASISENAYKLFVFAQTADGSLAEPLRIPLSGESPALHPGDMDGDGDTDVVIAMNWGVEIFLQSDGRLAEAAQPVATSVNPSEVRLGDTDDDADLDIVVTGVTEERAFRMLVLRNDGPAGFLEQPPIATDLQLDPLVGDVTGDGRDDIITRVYEGINVFRQVAAGLFLKETYSVPLPSWGLGMAVGDFTGDALLDVVWSTDGYPYELLLFPQTATGTLGEPIPSGGGGAQSLVPADMDGDGVTDLAMIFPQRGLGISLQQPSGGLSSPCHYDPAYFGLGVDLAVGDINGDLLPDMTIARGFDGLWIVRGTTPELAPTTVSLEAYGSMQVGAALDVSGDLSFLGGGCNADQPILIRRTNPDGSVAEFETQTDYNGHYSYTVPSAPAGTYTYQAFWGGDEHHLAGSSQPRTVVIEKQPGAITLDLSDEWVSYGEAITFDLFLSKHDETANREVFLYKYIDGVRTLVTSGTVDATGHLLVSHVPKRSASYIAAWTGDETYAAAESWMPVEVSVITTGELKGHYAKDGKWKLFHEGRAVKHVVKVRPNHAGERVLVELEARIPGWTEIGQRRFTLGGKSKVVIKLLGLPKGHSYRVNAWFLEDGDHAEDAHQFLYFKVTK